MRAALGFGVDERGPTFTEALRHLAEEAEEAGILVMVNGVVGSNTHRKLDPQEFRGFALVDDLAPLVFVNGADTKAAQVFTLAHELAHLWLGESALSDADLGGRPAVDSERWCNQVAAEFLVPLDLMREAFDPAQELTDELSRLARIFKVSSLVILRRVHDAGYLSWSAYRAAYRTELDRVLERVADRTSGGNFYNTQPVRVGKRFLPATRIGGPAEPQGRQHLGQRCGLRRLRREHLLAGRRLLPRRPGARERTHRRDTRGPFAVDEEAQDPRRLRRRRREVRDPVPHAPRRTRPLRPRPGRIAVRRTPPCLRAPNPRRAPRSRVPVPARWGARRPAVWRPPVEISQPSSGLQR